MIRQVSHNSESSFQSAQETWPVSRVVMRLYLSDSTKLAYCSSKRSLSVDISQILSKISICTLKRKRHVVVSFHLLNFSSVLVFTAWSLWMFSCFSSFLLRTVSHGSNQVNSVWSGSCLLNCLLRLFTCSRCWTCPVAFLVQLIRKPLICLTKTFFDL